MHPFCLKILPIAPHLHGFKKKNTKNTRKIQLRKASDRGLDIIAFSLFEYRTSMPTYSSALNSAREEYMLRLVPDNKGLFAYSKYSLNFLTPPLPLSGPL